MNDKHDDVPHSTLSSLSKRWSLPRRWFLQSTAGFAAVGVAALVVGRTTPGVVGQEQSGTPLTPPIGILEEDCGCGIDAAVPLMAVAVAQGKYYGLSGSESGPRVFSLNLEAGTNGAQRMSLGSPIKLNLPEDFVFGSLGIVRGQLALSGGLPFIRESLDVDDEMNDEVRAAMDYIPEELPSSGRRRVDVMGVGPSVFMLNPPFTQSLQLPKMPERSFAVATNITETASGSLIILIEHSENLNESYYAAAVDLLENQAGEWSVWTAGRELGESGPNHVGINGDDIVVGLNTSQGARLISRKRGLLSGSEAPSQTTRILALVPGDDGSSVLAKDDGSTRRWSPSPLGQSWFDSGQVQINGDEIVGAVAVAGARGQVVLLGRRSALLTDISSSLVGRTKGGNNHVM